MTKTNQYASATLTINLQAVRNNYAILKAKAIGAKVAAVVKADAYGLGMAKIAPVLAADGCDTFFVANLDEALELRNLLPDVTIFVLYGVASGQEEVFTAHGIFPVLNSIYQINIWQQHAVKKQEKLSCALHFDTGMNRLGMAWRQGFNKLHQISSLDIKYIMTHLACSDDDTHPMNSQQLKEFQMLTKEFAGFKLSMANSGGVFLGSEYHFDMVRPGVALYGVNPTDKLPNPMSSVVNLSSKILQLQQVDRAGTVGYGAAYKFAGGTKIATIAVGYADGYLRSLSNKGICAIDGVIVPVIGRVSMDLVTVDVTQIPDSKLAVGVEIELIGDNIPVDVVADKAGTIGYEILTSLGGRYKRVYK